MRNQTGYFLFFIKVQLICNVVLVSDVQQSNSVTYTHSYTQTHIYTHILYGWHFKTPCITILPLYSQRHRICSHSPNVPKVLTPYIIKYTFKSLFTRPTVSFSKLSQSGADEATEHKLLLYCITPRYNSIYESKDTNLK